ncbi:MAG: 4Fe-4S dicluster domain-containing protein [Cytophagales bacterium]|nr:MAG: Fe-S oxidoreductase [Rhodothermaeota bacterium MED-G19]
MNPIQQFLFIFLLIFFGYILLRRITIIKRNILLGEKKYKTSAKKKTRLKNLILIAFGQSKMFKKILPAVLHLMIYSGFIIINIEIIEIILDGILGTHRIFNVLGMPYYNVFISVIEFFVVLVLISCVIFLFRRNFMKIDRLRSPELKGWPIVDANLILVFEIILMLAILTMNASDLILQDLDRYNSTGNFYFSGFLKPLFINFSEMSLVILERTFWWVHIIGILLFAVYVTYSKHLHIFLAFPNIYHSDDQEKGKMNNMKSITNEIEMMMGLSSENVEEPPKRFGAKDITDLSWKNILEAYSCSECGRCTSVCPANITGKKLSPRKIMMDVRDRSEEIGKMKDKGLNHNDKSLLGDYISTEEIFACTSCNACVEECPININPLDIIIECRRYAALEDSNLPPEWNSMMQNIETNFSPWKFPIDDRSNWFKKDV